MKDKIMESGILLFDQNGFKSTSIQDIVQLLGVTKGTFYYYFSSKEELLKQIHLQYIEGLIEQQEEILKNPSFDFPRKLYEIVFMLIRNIKTKRPSARIFTREMRHLSEVNIKELKEKRNEFRRNTQKLIEQGIDQGEIKKGIRPDILTMGILGITNWSYYWYNPYGEVPEEKVVEIFLDLILNGISNNDSVCN
ncbi:TetR/AcrR family transcriptional regulator [Neobacillus muris]|uniref:TetR/AcrR family transcriptional regulator n=1 Tax=Neobacillus muris TaxID=2941334 RepID=UPI0020402BC7|nr:TetR/AcrR family transcriptional regulator [Neobacillus muris]